MADPIHLTALIDPLCGWCYGAAPTLERLGAQPGVTLDLMPTGLFAGEGARPMDASFADYAWANDQRIARLTGQLFSPAYRRQVLADLSVAFDSGPATLALIAALLEDATHGVEALHAIQRLRYVDGADITDRAVLARALTGLGLDVAAQRIVAPDAALFEAARERLGAARALMAEHGLRGVPALLATQDGRTRPLPSAALYGDPEGLFASLKVA